MEVSQAARFELSQGSFRKRWHESCQVFVQEAEDVQRNQLFQTKAQAKQGLKSKQNKNAAYDIGKGLEGQLTAVQSLALYMLASNVHSSLSGKRR